MNHVGRNLKKEQVIARTPGSTRGTWQSRECVSVDCFALYSHRLLVLLTSQHNDIYFVMLVDPSLRTICHSGLPTPPLAGPGLFVPVPSSGILMQYTG